MRQPILSVLFASILMAATSGMATACRTHMPPLPRDLEGVELVVVGRISDYQILDVSRRLARFDIQVDEVLKGEAVQPVLSVAVIDDRIGVRADHIDLRYLRLLQDEDGYQIPYLVAITALDLDSASRGAEFSQASEQFRVTSYNCGTTFWFRDSDALRTKLELTEESK
ncbi:hypothetical protein IQ03_01488 [Gemmobacter caeni]|jgi:hypothetical protein|uniref:Lipoprotein n=1 Tax=Gemmobacter caeni TaxID=589035 RepID=A0A2T6B1N9_9RHOB|nr:hypothetical protein [Gemmobacter caeni]PTX49942.1 hypothetical protein C8N34_106122 [Gemmobacter caeni]TWJ01838.1 hypothetical protein IQ03_01488 [Gemmobacter caeni]